MGASRDLPQDLQVARGGGEAEVLLLLSLPAVGPVLTVEIQLWNISIRKLGNVREINKLEKPQVANRSVFSTEKSSHLTLFCTEINPTI